MEIQWHGLSCVSVKGKNGTVLIDPYDTKAAGISYPSVKADVILMADSNELLSYEKAEGQHLFNWPGEYEAKGILFDAVVAHDRPKEKDDTKKDEAKEVLMFLLSVDDFKVAHLSSVGHKLTPEMLEKLGDIDILILPVGGSPKGATCLSAEKAQEVVEQIEPRMVIPMMYDCGQKLPLVGVEPFLKAVGALTVQPQKTLKLTGPAQLSVDKTEFVVLEPALA